MYEYLIGSISELNPSYLVLESNKTGWYINISLHSYNLFQKAGKGNEVKVYVQQIIREDAHLLFGFHDIEERHLFKLLLSVNGIGANTGRMILSSMTPNEIMVAIKEGNVNQLKKIKGIGEKSAQRLIIELKDKLDATIDVQQLIHSSSNNIKNEALSALVVLGFNKSNAEKIIEKLLQENHQISIEQLVKESLKRL